MPKKKSTASITEDKIKKKRNLKRNKKRGNLYECTIAKELRDLGFTGVVTSRSESKSMDDNKVDLIDTEHKLPFNAQLKATIKTPDFFGIKKECPFVDKPFIIFWKKTRPTDSTFRAEGELVMLEKSYFYELLKKSYENL